MTVRVGINGFGRIGRNFFRAAKASGADIDFVAVNDLGSIDTMAHLLQYDSVLGRFPDKVTATKSSIKAGGDTLRVLSERNPADLPWGELPSLIVSGVVKVFTRTEDGANLPLAELGLGDFFVRCFSRSTAGRISYIPLLDRFCEPR